MVSVGSSLKFSLSKSMRLHPEVCGEKKYSVTCPADAQLVAQYLFLDSMHPQYVAASLQTVMFMVM